jgi:hypothetical protein
MTRAGSAWRASVSVGPLGRRAAAALAVVLLAGCATEGGGSRRGPVIYASFAHSRSGQHLELYWSCARTDAGGLEIRGVALNSWEVVPIRFLSFDAEERDDLGRTISRGRGAAEESSLIPNFPVAFMVAIPPGAGPGRVELAYWYQIEQERPAIGRGRVLSTMQETVRDACGAGAHPNRTRPIP